VDADLKPITVSLSWATALDIGLSKIPGGLAGEKQDMSELLMLLELESAVSTPDQTTQPPPTELE